MLEYDFRGVVVGKEGGNERPAQAQTTDIEMTLQLALTARHTERRGSMGQVIRDDAYGILPLFGDSRAYTTL